MVFPCHHSGGGSFWPFQKLSHNTHYYTHMFRKVNSRKFWIWRTGYYNRGMRFFRLQNQGLDEWLILVQETVNKNCNLWKAIFAPSQSGASGDEITDWNFQVSAILQYSRRANLKEFFSERHSFSTVLWERSTEFWLDFTFLPYSVFQYFPLALKWTTE